MAGMSAEWPDLPSSGWTETGRMEFTEALDGSQTLAFFEPGTDGAMELTDLKVSPPRYAPAPPGWQGCRVYWGSHGCCKQRGHEGDCECDCCDCGEHHPYPDWPDEDVLCVAKAPYYGPKTHFYGEDREARGFPR